MQGGDHHHSTEIPEYSFSTDFTSPITVSYPPQSSPSNTTHIPTLQMQSTSVFGSGHSTHMPVLQMQTNMQMLNSQIKTLEIPIKSASSQQGPKPKAPVKERKIKDRDAPKKPRDASYLYIQFAREQYKLDHPNEKSGEVIKGLQAQWKNLNAEGRKSFVEEAREQQRKYNIELEAYNRSKLTSMTAEERSEEADGDK